jgi:drug/metabolite transporter (DMT)-like permease
VCTASAFLLFFKLIAEVGPAKSSMITFVNPAVAVAGGVVFLGETIKAGVVVGAPLVLVGLVLSTLRRGGGAGEPQREPEAHAEPGAEAAVA